MFAKFLMLPLLYFNVFSVQNKDNLIIYSSVDKSFFQPIVESYYRQTGIEISLYQGNAAEILKRVELEGEFSNTDLVVLSDVGRIKYLERKKLLEKITSKKLTEIVSNKYKSASGYWFGLTKKVLPIYYSKKRLTSNERLKINDYFSLADPLWKGRLCLSSSSQIENQSLVSSLINLSTEENVSHWIRGIVANQSMVAFGNGKSQLVNMLQGKCDLTFAYFNDYKELDNRYKDLGEEIGIIWPKLNNYSTGIHVNITAVGVLKSSNKIQQANNFLEFLFNSYNQKLVFSKLNEMPISNELSGSFASMNEQEVLLDELWPIVRRLESSSGNYRELEFLIQFEKMINQKKEYQWK
jgi:iron(III) transport system substrate-binding protein